MQLRHVFFVVMQVTQGDQQGVHSNKVVSGTVVLGGQVVRQVVIGCKKLKFLHLVQTVFSGPVQRAQAQLQFLQVISDESGYVPFGHVVEQVSRVAS